MLKLLAQGERDVAEGRLLPEGQVFEDLRRRLAGAGPDGRESADG